MKRLICIILVLAMLLSGCAVQPQKNNELDTSTIKQIEDLKFDSLDDEQLHEYIEDIIYSETVNSLDSSEYFVENVSTVYISKEYLEEVSYNSQEIFMNSFAFTTTDENKVDLWYNLGAA